MEKLERNSTITCPNCGFRKTELMELNSCQFFYECTKCKSSLKPREGDVSILIWACFLSSPLPPERRIAPPTKTPMMIEPIIVSLNFILFYLKNGRRPVYTRNDCGIFSNDTPPTRIIVH